MAPVKPKTVGESLYWSYANLAMACTGDRHNEPTYQKIDYIVRNKVYYGLLRGKLQLGSFLNDEKFKMVTSDACCYCGCEVDLTLDHLIPQFRGGEHSADNLVRACRSCNSSKKAFDLLEWMAKKGEFPPLVLLRRYLKLAIGYCVENGLMDIQLEPRDGASQTRTSLFDELEMNTILERGEGAPRAWPFAIGLIPHEFPDPINLVGWVRSASAWTSSVSAYPAWRFTCGECNWTLIVATANSPPIQQCPCCGWEEIEPQQVGVFATFVCSEHGRVTCVITDEAVRVNDCTDLFCPHCRVNPRGRSNA